MPRKSAGILLYRRCADRLEVFLIHHGGPYWANRDEGAWSIPKGEMFPEEEPLAAARREFEEETGTAVGGDFRELRPVRQAGGKIVHAWALEGDCDAETIRSNTYRMEWPPKSGHWQSYPEVDRAAWFSLEEARFRILKGQLGLLDQLAQLAGKAGTPE